ncbi:GNAT family N-acetyltransferase [Fusibacter sp. JL216-2]|uniref:GNAT family N-acetyltransferase n=1 Tax=Fusibacter sp. JL216-2 TaxID=3071453 RepID=UPI003D34BB7A
MTLELVKPSSALKIPFQKLVWDYIDHKDVYFMNKYKPALENFDTYVETLYKNSLGDEVEYNWVPYTTYWLIEKHDSDEIDVVGNIRIRHERVPQAGHVGYDIRPSFRRRGMGRKILELGLEKIKDFSIDDVYLTVEENNISSIHIIESLGGTFQRSFYDDETGETRLEYLISV